MMYKRLLELMALFFILSMLAAQCGPPATPQAAAPAETKSYKLAAIFPGVITDADYNTLGYIALTSVQADLGVAGAYSESVAVPDVERVMREYIDDGFNIIFTHGSQFASQTQALAKEFPDVHFIAESDAPAEDPPPNLWVIDRNFQVGFYPLGVIAAKQSKTGKIGYIGGLTLPFSYAEVHAIQQAIADQGLNVELKPVWAGDFNDPTKARELAEAMMAENIDVLIGSLNLGMFGVFEAVKGRSDVWTTAKYTDKTGFAPDNYITSVLYDFAGPLKEITQKIMDGENGGYYPLGFATGVKIQTPLKNASPELESELDQLLKDVEGGKITVVKDTTAIE